MVVPTAIDSAFTSVCLRITAAGARTTFAVAPANVTVKDVAVT